VGAVTVGVGVGAVTVGVGVGAVTVGVGVGAVTVGVGVGVVQVDLVMVLLSRVTAPFRASALPSMIVPVFTEIDCRARMLPTKVELVPSVAELPTCQKTLHGWAPLTRATTLPDAVMSVDEIWKMKTAFGSFCPSRVTVPVSPSEDVDW
jgi:hypothetical protein